MAAASIIAAGTTSTTSSDITLTAAFTLVALKAGAAVDSTIYVEAKDDASAYIVIDRLTTGRPSMLLAPGVYRFRRPAGPSCGCFQAA